MSRKINFPLLSDRPIIAKAKAYLEEIKPLAEADTRKIDLYKSVTEQLRKKEFWQYGDFKIAQWLRRSLEDYRDENKFQPLIPRINNLFDAISVFQKKINKYRSFTADMYYLKNKECLFETIMTIKNEDDILFKLIELDKEFLFVGKERILKAQAFGEDRFFVKLANTLKKGTNSELKKIKNSSVLLRNTLIVLYLNEDEFEIGSLGNIDTLKFLRELLTVSFAKTREDLEEIFSDKSASKIGIVRQLKQVEGALKILSDENYFIYKWLPRHILAKDRKK